MKSAAWACLTICLFLLVACDDRPAAPTPATAPATQPAAMQFRVDPALLGEAKVLQDFGVSVRPPAGWVEMPAAQLAAVIAGASTQPSDQTIVPLAIFRNPEAKCLLTISTTPAPSAADEQKNLARWREQFGDVKSGSFQVNGLTVTQYLVRPPGTVNFKLLLAGKPAAKQADHRLQLDYIVPQSAWSNQVHAVESSIGSLRATDVP